MLYIGVDFGGTKIEAAALTAEGEFLARHREPNPGSYDGAIRLVRDLIARAEAEARGKNAALGDMTVGIGSPGSASPRHGLMRNSNSTYLNGRPFKADMEAALGRPIKLANDANCLALSEARDGAAAGAANVFAVIIGTGCGGGVVVDGKLVEGANGLAGEWGHIPLPWPRPEENPGPKCWCGLHGCLETWISGSGFARDFRATTGRDLKGEDIIPAMRAGDTDARAAFDRWLRRLAQALAVVVNILDPDVFVFGGGMSNITEMYDGLQARIEPLVFTDRWQASFVPARWGDSSGVRGAAYLWDQGRTIK